VVDQPDRSEMSLLAWFQQVVTTSKVDVEEEHARGHFRLAIRIKRRGTVRESWAEFRVAYVICDSMTTVRRMEKCRPCEAGIHIIMTIAYTHICFRVYIAKVPATQNAVCRSGLRSLSAAECYILSRLF